MRAILVSVDYADILSITLPYNRHHFDEVLVVTVPDDPSIQIALQNNCYVLTTNSFYDDGAVFNKWKALEQGLDAFVRHGWICVMDADFLWPKEITLNLDIGNLYTPLLRMAPLKLPIPAEIDWHKFPVHRNTTEWAGYSQIFNANDPHLGDPPWHETNWRHAGGADSMFQLKWPLTHKKRPPWEVLHLGECGVNWCGRSSPYLDGTEHPRSRTRFSMLREFIKRRKIGPKRFDGEKLTP